jgi:histidinol-phosphatase
MLAFAHELADIADTITLPAFARDQRPDTKTDGTWVTDVDRTVERTLRERILARFPDHAVLGEEDGHLGPVDAPTWVLDPIDGTTNFVKHNPVFATLIALRVEGDDVVGVASAPALASRWDGVVGSGAHQDGRAIMVSATTRVAHAEVAFGGLDLFADRGRWPGVGRLVGASARQRGYGDFWGHCLVASGSTDVCVEAAVSTWDLAAVRAIVVAAGGRFSDLDGVATADGGSAVSSNGALHDEVLRLLA